MLSARERRTVMAGLVVSLVGLTVAYAVLPFARRWSAREDMIAARTEQLVRLQGLIAHEAELRDAVSRQTLVVARGPQRLLTGGTSALAAASLQSALQSFADQSQVTVSRLDVAGAPDTTTASLPMIPATVSAIGDIYGITSMLSFIQHGPQLLEISELNVRPNPALRGELLQFTVKLHAAYLGS